jgi:hypothetical protein
MTKEKLQTDGLALDEWFSAICAKAASTLRHKFPDGLLSMVTTQEEYNKLKGKHTVKPNIVITDTETVDEDTFSKKKLATVIEIQTFRKDITENSTAVDNILEFIMEKTDIELIETTFPAMEEIYKNTLLDIITKIKEEVSAPYQIEKRKNYLKKQLMENIKVEETYQQYINRTNKIKYMLQDNYQVIYTEGESIEIMENATTANKSIQKVIMSYKIKCSTNLEESNFNTLSKLIKTTLDINGITTEEANYKETALKVEKVETRLRYCYKHGYQKSHQGIECRYKLTDLQKLAGSPRDVEDGCTTGDPFKKPPK